MNENIENQTDQPGVEAAESGKAGLTIGVDAAEIPSVSPTIPADTAGKPMEPRTLADFEANARSMDSVGESQQQLSQRQALAASGHGMAASITDIEVNKDAPAKVLPGRRLRPAEDKFRRWSVICDHGTVLRDLLNPAFWTHHGSMLKAGDEIRVECEDGSWVTWLYVQVTGPKEARVHPLGFLELDPTTPDEFAVPTGYSVKWRGLHAKFTVLRGNEVIKENFESRSDAQRWLGNHVTAMQR